MIENLFGENNRRFVLKNVVIAPAIVNVVVAFSLVYLVFTPMHPVELWGEKSGVIDLIMGSLFASLITGFIALFITRVQCEAGKLTRIESCIPSGFWRAMALNPLKSMLLGAFLVFLVHIILLNVLSTLISAKAMPWTLFIALKIFQALYISLITAGFGTWLSLQHYSCRATEQKI